MGKNYTFRYFNKRQYRVSDQGWGSKKEAQGSAKSLRMIGYLVRVIKVGKWWKLAIAEEWRRRKK